MYQRGTKSKSRGKNEAQKNKYAHHINKRQNVIRDFEKHHLADFDRYRYIKTTSILGFLNEEKHGLAA